MRLHTALQNSRAQDPAHTSTKGVERSSSVEATAKCKTEVTVPLLATGARDYLPCSRHPCTRPEIRHVVLDCCALTCELSPHTCERCTPALLTHNHGTKQFLTSLLSDTLQDMDRTPKAWKESHLRRKTSATTGCKNASSLLLKSAESMSSLALAVA